MAVAPGPDPRAALRCTGRHEGDLAPAAQVDEAARRSLSDGRSWVWSRQVHGAEVVVVDRDTAPDTVRTRRADALVTVRDDIALAVFTADCAPVVLVTDGAVGVAHAGWRGLVAGVVERTVDAMAELDPGRVPTAFLGPCVGVECYEFAPGDATQLVDRFGAGVLGRTASGRPAVDLAEAVDAALAGVGVGPAERLGGCTACTPEPASEGGDGHRWYSHRARGESERQATVVWRRRGDEVRV